MNKQISTTNEANHDDDSVSVSSSNSGGSSSRNLSVLSNIPDGIPKSGRIWKKKQTVRSSTIKRQGVLKHLSNSFEKKRLLEQQQKQTKEYEKELRNETKQKKIDARLRREENQKRRMENEYKSVVVQQVRTDSCSSRFVWSHSTNLSSLIAFIYLD